MKVSYLVTCSTETTTLQNLLRTLRSVNGDDQIFILMDQAGSEETHNILGGFHHWYGCTMMKRPLDNNFGQFKNYGIENCSGDYIFAIDGDELPPDSLLGENLHQLLDSNPEVEAYAIPRINAWHGLTEKYKNQWSLDISPTYNRLRANWPDYQWRIFKRDYPRIQFKKRLHERIDGYTKFVILPADETYALYHDKTIETQLKTNLRYNKDFTASENAGI
jgi:glycosyltransferase involved in cell wall biosynthesis